MTQDFFNLYGGAHGAQNLTTQDLIFVVAAFILLCAFLLPIMYLFL